MCHSLYYHCHSMICHYQCAASNQCSLSFSVSLSVTVCFSADCLCVCFSAFSMPLCVSSVSGPSCQCPAVVYLRAAHLGSHHSHGSGQRCLCYSVPHQSDCSQLRQSPSVLLPLYWPKLTAGGKVRATTGPEVQWVPKKEKKKPLNHIRCLATTLKPVSRLHQLSLSICHHHFLHMSSFCACFLVLPPAPAPSS